MTAIRALELIQVASVCSPECESQPEVRLDGVARLINAYCFALDAQRDRLPTTFDVHALASIIEPVKTRDGYRTVPVTFDDGGGSAQPTTIHSAMERMFEALDGDVHPDEFVKSFLRVHPFVDGNGRIAFILHNWLSDSLLDPHPLPDYFGVDAA